MNQQRSDTANFLFTSNIMNPDTFHVMAFEGVDEVSRPYEIDLLVSTTSASGSQQPPDIAVNSMPGSTGTLFIYRNNQYFPYSGIVIMFRFEDKTVDFSSYRLKLMPRMWKLSLEVRSRVFQNMSIIDIIKRVLDGGGLRNYYTINCGNYPVREFVMQYDESDLNFISRLMEEAGIWYFFTEAPVAQSGLNAVSSEQLVITERPTAFRTIPQPASLLFRETGGMTTITNNNFEESISRLTMETHISPANMALKNYNYRTPEIDISAQAQVTGGTSGTYRKFGGSQRDVTQIQSVLSVETRRMISNQTHIRGSGDCRAVRAGTFFDLTDAPHTDFGNRLVVEKVTHKGKQANNTDSSFKECTYTNQFEAITAAAMVNYCPQLKTPRPIVNGIFTAPIEGMGSPYAYLDDQGRYKIRIPFDTETPANGQATKPVRLSQPYSGQGYGIHFPSHESAEMIVGCINGDPDKPIGLGTIPNANTISPVRNANKHEGVIRTAGGNEIVLDDLDAKQKITVKSAAANKLLLDDEHKKVVLQSTADNKLVIDDDTKVVTINAQQHLLSMSYDSNASKITLSTANGHTIILDDQNQLIEIKSTGGHKVVMDDSSNVMTLTDDNGTNTITLDRNAGISLETDNAITIRAQGDLTLEGANVNVQTSGNCSLSADADITMQGANVDVNADVNATVNGSTQLKVTGGNATFEASGMGEVKAGGIMAVQGSIVNIN